MRGAVAAVLLASATVACGAAPHTRGAGAVLPLTVRAVAWNPSVQRAFEVLAPGGRLSWISPFPVRTRAVAAACGFGLERALDVDMGGFSAELQLLRRPLPTSSRS